MTIFRSKILGAMGGAALLAASPLDAQAVSVPSGAEVELFDVMFEDSPSIARFRFVAPMISPSAEGLQFNDVVADLDYLCSDVVLPALVASARTAEAVIISLSEREIAFGEVAPDVVQFFQPFDVSDGTCIWEEF